MNPEIDPFAKWKRKSLDEKSNEDPFARWKNSEDKEIKAEPKEEKSFLNDVLVKSIKETPEGLGGQIALGLSQAATAPFDLAKMWLIGEGLMGLEEAQEASERMGIPFDIEAEKQKFLSAMEYLPTQQLAEDLLEKHTGISTKSKDALGKVFRGVAEFAGLAPKGTKIPKLQPKNLAPESQALRQTAEEFRLTKFAGMEAEKTPSITPIVSAEKEAQLAKELGETSKQAIDDVIADKIPIKEMRDKGINLEDAYTVAYDSARKTAAKMGDTHIDFSNVIDWINKEIKRVKRTSPSLSNSKKAYINVLRKEKNNLTKKVSAKEGPVLYGPQGEILTPPAKAKIVQKKMSADQSLNQYQGFNDNVKGIWKKPEFAGSEQAVIDAYAGLKNQLIQSIEKVNPELAKELGFANRVFHNTQKLKDTEKILRKAFKDGYNPKKLHTILTSDRSRIFLERNIGKEAVQDLEKIAHYGMKAQEKVFSQLKNPKTIGQFFSEMSPVKFGLLTLKTGLNIPLKGAPLLLDIGKAGMHRIQGYLFTRNSTKKSYMNYLKEASKSVSSPSFKKASLNLSKSILNEFGSEEELLEMAKSED